MFTNIHRKKQRWVNQKMNRMLKYMKEGLEEFPEDDGR